MRGKKTGPIAVPRSSAPQASWGELKSFVDWPIRNLCAQQRVNVIKSKTRYFVNKILGDPRNVDGSDPTNELINNNTKIDPHLGDVDDSNLTSYEVTYCSCFCW